MKHFHLGAASGVIAAATSGTIFAFRNPTPEWRYIQAFEATLTPTATAAFFQGIAAALTAVGACTGDFTGGTDLSDLTGAGAANYAISTRINDTQRIRNADKLPTSTLAAGNVRIAATGALGGGVAGRAQPFKQVQALFPAAGPLVGPLTLAWNNPAQGLEHEDPLQGCIILPPDTAFIIRLPAALGAAFTAELDVSIDFLE
jgi:hypothetical protein